uniref:uncharacterized protein LOC110899693 n=1 Tax=Helianthus annuus TaxID=4232 RepID=UPI000B9046C2|nr:uncharacterized protein LOC110899693 [Helianthus annuus]
MARTGVRVDKKGKAQEEPSHGASKKAKKQLLVVEEPGGSNLKEEEINEGEEAGEEEEVEEEDGNDDEVELVFDEDGIPKWDASKRLSRYPIEHRADMYRRKLKQSTQHRIDLFLCEKFIILKDFRAFGIEECFKKLGWVDFLQFTGEDDIYMDEVIEWMSSLEKDEGNNPPVTTQLIGKVNGVKVVLSFKEIKKISKYDTKATRNGSYIYPKDAELADETKTEGWKTRVRSLFEVPPGVDLTKWSLKTDYLRPMARFLIRFITYNVMPRTSDLGKVRFPEMLVLVALITGAPKLSAKHLIMYNVWEAREREQRMMIPHARLLSLLLKKQGSIPKGVRGFVRKQTKINMQLFTKSSRWMHSKTRTKHRLTVQGTHEVPDKYVEGQRSDVEEDEEDEEINVQANIGVEEGVHIEVELEPRRDVNEDEGAPQAVVLKPYLTGFTPEMFRTPYYFHMYDAVIRARPPVFGTWDEYKRIKFDRQSQAIEETRMFQKLVIWQNQQRIGEESSSHEPHGMDAVLRGYYEMVRTGHDTPLGV